MTFRLLLFLSAILLWDISAALGYGQTASAAGPVQPAFSATDEVQRPVSAIGEGKPSTSFTVPGQLAFFATGQVQRPISASGQRAMEFQQYSAAWFDSIRSTLSMEVEPYTIRAYRLSESEHITIDGHLSEPAWQKAQRVSGLLEKEPYPLIPLSEETEFAILYDDHNLYIGVWCRDSEPHRIIQELTPRGISAPDHLMFFLDSYHDRRSGYKFVVSPTGVQVDELRYDDVKRDANWNGVWQSAGSVDEHGWYAEVKIPFYNLRFRDVAEHTWGFNIMRVISKNGSRGQWKPHLPEWDNNTRMSQLGQIEGIYGIHPGRNFEIRPYGLAGITETAGTSPTRELHIGADIRYSPNPNFTADFTVNPDFAQVDADVFDINLTRHPTRFQELRPFFTERTNIFNTPIELFYSRRIGAGEDILGGVKITGKLGNGFEFGTLGNITGQSAFSQTQQSKKAGTGAQYGVFRLKKDITSNGSIGLIAATSERDSLYNRVFGLDGSFVYRTHNLVEMQMATGRIEDGFEGDMAYSFSYTRTGDLIGGELAFERIEPFFEINRIGYIRKEHYRGWNRGSGLVRISPRINSHGIRRITLNLGVTAYRDLITERYINTWLAQHPQTRPDPLFGEVEQDEDGRRSILFSHHNPIHSSHQESLAITLMNEMVVSGGFEQFSASELTGSYTGNRWNVAYATRPHSMGTSYAGKFTLHGSTYYNFTQNYVGTLQGIILNGSGRLRYNMRSGLQGEATRTYDHAGDQDGHFWKLSSNTTWMFTKDMYVRIHGQGLFGTTYYDDDRLKYNQYLLSLLFSWEYRPGSFIYLAYNEGRIDESDPFISRHFAFQERTALLKVSYLLNR